VKARLRMLQHAQPVSGNISSDLGLFQGLPAFFYLWKSHYERNGAVRLQDQARGLHHIHHHISPEIASLILRIREERCYGATRTVSTFKSTITPTFRRRPSLRFCVVVISVGFRWKRYRPGPRPADAPLQVPGRFAQLDVNFVS
jgi:hypothetical protein